ncbi:hypothetical protein Q31a_28310 [Aureliella helgolandensis]|uniref:Uncharacterized protein n=1 Tax=Aureliella helgolandensis TaxID=2527968 RepID=A0A518G7F2_9BACT|nr:hypothetical protein Q31a_28310 [Aureliella helgolandensis]
MRSGVTDTIPHIAFIGITGITLEANPVPRRVFAEYVKVERRCRRPSAMVPCTRRSILVFGGAPLRAGLDLRQLQS